MTEPRTAGQSRVVMAAVHAKFGVAPASIPDYLALVGDTSDNVPGVKGIGDKTACALVSEYGSLEEILAHAAEIKQKRPREALLEHGDLARLSKQLVTIHDDLPVTLDLERLRISEPEWARLRPSYVGGVSTLSTVAARPVHVERVTLGPGVGGSGVAGDVDEPAGGAGGERGADKSPFVLEFDGFQVFAAAEAIGNPLAFLA